MDPVTQAALLDLAYKAAYIVIPLAVGYLARHYHVPGPLVVWLMKLLPSAPSPAVAAASATNSGSAAATPVVTDVKSFLAGLEARAMATIESVVQAKLAAATVPASPPVVIAPKV